MESLASKPVPDKTAPAAPTAPRRRIPVGAEVYNRITEFLYDEARLLDQIRLKEWAALLDTDLKYRVPVRQTRSLADQADSFVRSVQHYYDDYRSIMGRVMRLTATKSAWAEDPPSRTRRLITNVLVESTEQPNEYAVISYLLLTRSRFNHDEYDLISGERHDLLRQAADGSFKIAQREVLLDQAVLGTPNLAIFL